MTDITTIKQIEELIIQGRIDDALGQMRDLFQGKKAYPEIMAHSAAYRQNEQMYRVGVLDLKDYMLVQNKIIQALIQLLVEKPLMIPDNEPEVAQPFSVEKSFKEFGNLKTKMLPIFPYKRDKPLKIENVVFDYYPDKVFDRQDYPAFFEEVEAYIRSRKTIYNEAKPHLLDYIVTFSEEEKEHFMEIQLGICGYTDFLAVSRNLDVEFDLNGKTTTYRKELVQLGVDKDPTLPQNRVPKQLGVSSIILTTDNFIVLQKRQKSEVASKMYHVSIAEGLQAYPSYKDFLNLENSEKQFKITDKTLSLALYRGLDEELGIDDKDVRSLELLSMYFDYELQQPIFQTCTYLNIDSQRVNQYYQNLKGRDTLAEINQLDFVPFNLDEILLHVYQKSQEGTWSSHAIINIISFLERHFGSENQLKNTVNKYFRKPTEYYLGPQQYIKSIRQS